MASKRLVMATSNQPPSTRWFYRLHTFVSCTPNTCRCRIMSFERHDVRSLFSHFSKGESGKKKRRKKWVTVVFMQIFIWHGIGCTWNVIKHNVKFPWLSSIWDKGLLWAHWQKYPIYNISTFWLANAVSYLPNLFSCMIFFLLIFKSSFADVRQ